MDNRRIGALAHIGITLFFCVAGCAHPLVRASSKPLEPIHRTFATDANRVYYAIRFALAKQGYPVAHEDLPGGMIHTAWVPTTADSHWVQPFQTPDYGTTAGYHQLHIRVMPEGGGTTRVEVASHIKSVVAHVQSSGRAERAVLAAMADYLRSGASEVTNLGVEE